GGPTGKLRPAAILSGPLDSRQSEDPMTTDRRRGRPQGAESKARQAYFLERTRATKLENDRKAGLLIDAERVRRDQFAIARQVRDRVMGLPARLAPTLEGLSRVDLELRLEDGLREALTVLADELAALREAPAPTP